MARSRGIRWKDRKLMVSLGQFNSEVDRALTAAISYHATRATAYARQNAPWTDRTGNARNGLFARAEHGQRVYRIIIAHSVPYGIWLESRWSGRYAIIRPTVDHESVELMRTVSDLFSRM